MVSLDREEMIVENIGLVHTIANRFRGRGIDYDDLYQSGCIGLIKAVDNFDRTKGYMFSTYAVPVIMGEIKRLFRDGGSIKVSRCLKEKAIKVQAIRDRFVRENQREPTISELSSASQVEREELSQILNIISPVISLSHGDENEIEEYDIPIDDTDKMFDRLDLILAINSFSPFEKILIKKRYFEGKTQSETAKILGISQVQVSRREKALLLRLRELLE